MEKKRNVKMIILMIILCLAGVAIGIAISLFMTQKKNDKTVADTFTSFVNYVDKEEYDQAYEMIWFDQKKMTLLSKEDFSGFAQRELKNLKAEQKEDICIAKSDTGTFELRYKKVNDKNCIETEDFFTESFVQCNTDDENDKLTFKEGEESVPITNNEKMSLITFLNNSVSLDFASVISEKEINLLIEYSAGKNELTIQAVNEGEQKVEEKYASAIVISGNELSIEKAEIEQVITEELTKEAEANALKLQQDIRDSYEPVIVAYRAASINESDTRENDYIGELFTSYIETADTQNHHEEPELFYALYDICQDGYPELLLSRYDTKSNNYYIFDIWSSDGSNIQRTVTPVHNGGAGGGLVLCENCVVKVFWASGGMSSGGRDFYQMSANEMTAPLIDSLAFGGMQNFTHNDAVISQDEFKNIEAQYVEITPQVEWISINE